MTEQTAAQLAKKAAEDRAKSGEVRQPAPIDQRTRKPRPPASLPRAMRTTPGMDHRLFDSFKDEMELTPASKDMFGAATMALQAASDEIETVADAEDQIIDNHNKAVAAGTATGHVQMVDGRARTVPTRLEELAELADASLGTAITKHENRVNAHNTKMLGLLQLMEKATLHPDTARDHTLMGQVRSHLASLGKGKAKNFAVKEALAGNRAVIHTVLHTPAFLSGLDDDAVGEVRKAAKQSLTPDLLKAYEVGERMEKALVVAAKTLTKKRTALGSYRVEGERLATEALNKLRKG